MLKHDSRWFIVLLGALSGMTALSIDMSLAALPTLTRTFATTPDRAALTLSLFLLGYSAGQLVYGPVSDRYGRRPPLLAGLALFAVGGLGCAVSATIGQLILWRMVQGLGACAGPILARAVVRDRFEPRRGAQILSYITLVMAVAPLLAPLIGGYLLLIHWRAIFAVLAVMGLLILIASWIGLGETIARRNARATHPVQLMRNLREFLSQRACIAYALIVCFVFSGMFAYISGAPFVLIEVLGVRSDHFGYFFGLSALPLMAGALLNSRLLRRHEPVVILRGAVLLVLFGGLAMVSLSLLRIGGVAGIVGPMLIYMLGLGLLMPNAIAGAMELVPHMAGFASSVIGALQTAGGSLVAYGLALVYNRSAVPMASCVALGGMAVALVFFGMIARRPAPGAGRPVEAAPR